MPYYAVLANWTEEGVRTVKEAPARTEALRRSVEGAGGKVLAMLHTMGTYDAVVILELPSDQVANELMLRAGMEGFVRTTTLKGWSPAEFSTLVGKL
ncbi:MAG TPA: GYD domain-containing protein [Thermoplasmata archaeon]|nr:GYD domain-containing protein [Thermoplasmata archaeon]